VTLKRVVVSILALVGVVLVAAAGGLAWLLTADLTPWVEDYASKAIERRVTIGTLKIEWGNPLSLEVTDLKVANAPWGSVPDMISIGSLSALLDPWSISSGVLKFQKLRAVKPVIVLERDKDGTGNWKFAGAGPASPDQFALVPKYRNQFSTLLDFEMKDGMVSYKGVSSYRLQVDLHEVTIQSAGDDQPVKLAADGAYNGTPAKLTAETDSFLVLRDKAHPFGANLSMAAASATVVFKGTVIDPLNFDGVEGPIEIDAKKLGDLLKVFSADIGINPPLLLAGAFRHGGDHWEITLSKGKIATSALTGDLVLDEGPRGRPDNVSTTLRFGDLDLNPLLAGAGRESAAPADFTAVSLRLDPNRDTNIDASIDAKQLIHGTSRVAGFGLHATLVSGAATLSRLTLAFAGGKIDASGSAGSVAGGTHVAARGALSGADAAQLALYVDALAGKLTGRVDGGFNVDMTGDTLGDAMRASRGHAVLGMVQGSVSRDLMEKLSTDLHNLFGKRKGSAQVACLLGIVDLRNGLAVISPLELRSTAGTVIGGGQVDILGKRLDITIQSESATTGLLALDIPIRISGSFADPSIDPQIGAGAKTRKALLNSNPTQNLSPELRGLAERNPCLH
jgi:AsmA family protein